MLFLEEVPLLLGEGQQFHPTPMVFEHVRVVELGVDLDLREGPIEVLLCFLKVVARLEGDDLNCKDLSIMSVPGLVHLCKAT